MKLRIEVTDRHGTVAEVFDPDELRQHLKPRQLAQLGTITDGVIRELVQATGYDEDWARQVIAAELMRLVADEAAYERIAERRGLLPL
jgi:hypothetical protein